MKEVAPLIGDLFMQFCELLSSTLSLENTIATLYPFKAVQGFAEMSWVIQDKPVRGDDERLQSKVDADRGGLCDLSLFRSRLARLNKNGGEVLSGRSH